MAVWRLDENLEANMSKNSRESSRCCALCLAALFLLPDFSQTPFPEVASEWS